MTRGHGRSWFVGVGIAAVFPTLVAGATVSFSREVAPILDRSCVACHQPAKLKGKLDLSSFSALSRGGKHGGVLIPEKPGESRLLTQVRGPKPEMPPEGQPLSQVEVQTLEQWVLQGAHDDTAPGTTAAVTKPVRYQGRPVISSLAWSPSGSVLAVPGNGEVILVAGDTWEPGFRLRGDSDRVEAVQFSPDGKTLAVAAGTPSRWGEIQFWDPVSGRQLRSVRVGPDSVFGVSWSPDGSRVVFGGADRTVRAVEVATGREVMRFDQHTDWVMGACFTLDGTRVVTAGRDRSMKLIEAANGRLIDEVCRSNEPLLGVLLRPRENWVAGVGGEYRIRVYRAQARADANDPNADPNFVREYDGFEGGTTAAAFSPEGAWIATAGTAGGEVRVHDAASGARAATLRDQGGVVFGVAFSPDGTRLATAGYEGLVRVYRWKKEQLEAVINPFPVPGSESSERN